ncbi:MAG: phage replisome organizer N-terminal domain-containing protein, partial [Clostridia bacterium]|nr:phage replisome organizer N-terminal domain-containing protein [Clostridia bacterium]
MNEVKWVKIMTDIFDNRKIKHLRRLPNGDLIVLIWIMLLTLAGRCNADGRLFLTESIPY